MLCQTPNKLLTIVSICILLLSCHSFWKKNGIFYTQTKTKSFDCNWFGYLFLFLLQFLWWRGRLWIEYWYIGITYGWSNQRWHKRVVVSRLSQAAAPPRWWWWILKFNWYACGGQINDKCDWNLTKTVIYLFVGFNRKREMINFFNKMTATSKRNSMRKIHHAQSSIRMTTRKLAWIEYLISAMNCRKKPESGHSNVWLIPWKQKNKQSKKGKFAKWLFFHP